MSIRKTPPRSLLFLSCDIVGSTAFKQSKAAQDPSEPWQVVFLSFYQTFPHRLRRAQETLSLENLKFSLWKPVGDELIFTCEISSEEDVSNALKVWVATIKAYAKETLAKSGLGAKGGAFIATFPGPDSDATIPRNPGEVKSERDVVTKNDEALAHVNHAKFMYDYFGPSIDTGFRVLSQCNARFFTISVEVAFVLSSLAKQPAYEDSYQREDLIYLDSFELKGVWGGRPYPLFALDLEYDDDVNKALRDFTPKRHDINRIHTLCQACHNSPEPNEWPFKIYLPDAVDKRFKSIPKDTLAAHRSLSVGTKSGDESVASEAESPRDMPSREETPTK